MAKTQRVSFRGATGHSLTGRLELPDDEAETYVLFAHCFTCSKNSLAASRVSRALTQHGFGVLRFDFTGLGSSDGDFANTDFSSNVDDLLAAAAFLDEHYRAPELLIGHSLGGAAVLAATSKLQRVKAVATIGAPSSPQHVTQLFDDQTDIILDEGEACVNIAGRHFKVKRAFLDDLEHTKLGERIARLGAALLVFHSPTDEVVGIDNAREIYDHAKHPKSFVALDGADHLLTDQHDAEYVASVLAAWATRYLGNESTSPSQADRATNKSGQDETEADSWVSVEEAGSGQYQQEIRVRGHRLVSDEPASVGGSDAGPTPYELLSAALGACTNMTLRMYALRKGLNLERVSVALRHGKIHASDCENCETKTGKVDHIERRLQLVGDLSHAERERLLEIADRCPVHRTLHSEVEVRTSLQRNTSHE